ncbi:MAG: helix-turn-helix transcriptional regulator [Clostridiales bacterium]|nr:helix-turn-helix transcriptional regulator [Clostridiales bacterium]
MDIVKDIDILKASEKLSLLELNYSLGAFDIEIFWFRIMEKKDDWHIVRHTHSSYELHYVAKGNSLVVLDDNEFVVNENQFYITKPHEYHRQKAFNSPQYIEYSINWSINLNDNADQESGFLYHQLKNTQCAPYNDKNGVCGLIECSLKSAFYEKFGYYNEIKHYIVLILIAITKTISLDALEEYDIPHKQKKNDLRFLKISQYINENIASPIMTSDIASYIHLSDKQVSRIIKAETELSTKQYINLLKRDKAKELLKNTEYSVKQIAGMVGFSSEYYFNKFFKREEGYPPGRYRNNTLHV